MGELINCGTKKSLSFTLTSIEIDNKKKQINYLQWRLRNGFEPASTFLKQVLFKSPLNKWKINFLF